MTTSEKSNSIDEKKEKETGKSIDSMDYKGFITNYISSIFFTITLSIFVIGSIGLYTTKIAQANILPDDIELAPYTLFDRVVNEHPVDINIMRPSFLSENKDTLSQKALFNSKEYLDSFNNSFLCSLKKSADPNGGIMSNASLYFSKVFDNLTAKNYLAINTLFLYLSQLPESIIMILYGFFGIFLWVGLYFFNICISIFYHIINIPQLFREPIEQSSFIFGKDDTKQWEEIDEISFFRLVKFLLFFFIWIPIGTLSAFIVPIFFTIYGLLSPLYATYRIKQNGTNNKSYNVLDFIKDTFAYKKFFFFILATISLISNGTKYLANNAIIGIIIAIMFAYFMGLYTNEMPEQGKDGFTFKIRQNMIPAKVSEINKENPLLVKVCEPILERNSKLDKRLAKGKYRQLTKSKNVDADYDKSGGNNDNSIYSIENSKETDNYSSQVLNQIQEPVPVQEPTNNSFMKGGRRKGYNIRFT
jgi:hypothetical protein